VQLRDVDDMPAGRGGASEERGDEVGVVRDEETLLRISLLGPHGDGRLAAPVGAVAPHGLDLAGEDVRVLRHLGIRIAHLARA
jgi:hypothetical protein